MLNYTVKLESVKDLVELKKIANRYGIKGKMEQNGFHGDMKSVFRSLIYLPLDHVNVEIDGYSESQAPYITEAMRKLSA
ncbi:MAG: hypothetical protein K6E16_08365 [Lachnospiraceae bacterium]|nr:hypothetical protein [Lachnospiraceae bacterium]